MWDLQDKVDIKGANSEILDIIYGEQDLSVDVKSLLNFLNEEKISYRSHSLPRSGHALLADYAWESAVETILGILTGNREKS